MSKDTLEWDNSKTYSGLPAPDYWHIVERRADGLMWERMRGEPITVIESTSQKDGRTWLHVSVAKPRKRSGQIPKVPTYEDLQTARTLFIGETRECYMIFPPEGRYVNIGPVLHHLFCCLDQPDGVLPHFEAVTRIGGKQIVSI